MALPSLVFLKPGLYFSPSFRLISSSARPLHPFCVCFPLHFSESQALTVYVPSKMVIGFRLIVKIYSPKDGQSRRQKCKLSF